MSDTPSGTLPSNPFNPAIAAIIRIKALSLAERPGLARQDWEDLEQDLRLHVWRRRGRFDGSRATWAAFVRCLVESYGENLVRDRLAAKRGHGRAGPLTDEVPDNRGGRETRARAFEAAVASLPAELREVVELLCGGTVTSTARQLGVSRTKVYAMLREVRERLEFRELVDDP